MARRSHRALRGDVAAKLRCRTFQMQLTRLEDLEAALRRQCFQLSTHPSMQASREPTMSPNQMHAERATADRRTDDAPDIEALAMTLSPGTHLTTPRRGFVHHGIYCGDGRVIHYAGFSRGCRRGPVEEVSLDCFSGGRRVTAHACVAPAFDAQAIVARARSRLGEDHYRVCSNNCEHFCEWCISGTSRSRQVEAWRRRVSGAALFGRRLRLPTFGTSEPAVYESRDRPPNASIAPCA